jgi:hypothetical protein
MKGSRFTCAILAGILLGFCLNVPAAEPDYYARFLEDLKSGQSGFVEDASLVDTNTPIPISTNTSQPTREETNRSTPTDGSIR